MLLGEAEKKARELFIKAGVESPGLCARLLAGKACGLDKLECLMRPEKPLSPAEEEVFTTLIKRRAKGEPLAYILGKKEFYDHAFAVSPAVLVPRPETELIVDLALKFLAPAKIIFADLGCGSGCIGLSLLAKRPEWSGLLLDISEAALKMARINALAMAPGANIAQGDIFSLPLAFESLDLIVSNPPYIAADDNSVMPDVLEYEPRLALFSENGGRAHLAAVIGGARNALRKGGGIILEHGEGQGEAVREMLRSEGFTNINIFRDLAGKPRCAMARRRD